MNNLNFLPELPQGWRWKIVVPIIFPSSTFPLTVKLQFNTWIFWLTRDYDFARADESSIRAVADRLYEKEFLSSSPWNFTGVKIGKGDHLDQ